MKGLDLKGKTPVVTQRNAEASKVGDNAKSAPFRDPEPCSTRLQALASKKIIGSANRASGCAGRACSSSRLPAMTSCQRGCARQAKVETHTVNLRSAARHAVCGTVYWIIVSCILLHAHADRAESSFISVLLASGAYGCVRSVAEWFIARLPTPAKCHPIANLVG